MKPTPLFWMAAVLSVLLPVAVGYAALPEAPSADLDPAYADWVDYLVTLVLLLAVAAASFKSAKRSHLD